MMGCTSHKQQNFIPIRKPTISGHLIVQAQDAHLEKASTLGTYSPYLILTISNQKFVGKTQKKDGQNPFFGQKYDFVLNSCYKPHGRSLQVQLWNEGTLNDKLLGMGIIDLDPLINNKKGSAVLKVYLNHHCQEVGFVNLELNFQEYQTETLSFKFQEAEVTRKTSHFKAMKCWVEVVLGEQVLRTKKSSDQEYLPAWQDQVLIFSVPKKLVKHCWIVLYDSDTEVGRLRMPIAQLMENEKQQKFVEQLEHRGKKAALLKFRALKGQGDNLQQFLKTSRFQTQNVQSSIIKDQLVEKKQFPQKQGSKEFGEKKNGSRQQSGQQQEPKLFYEEKENRKFTQKNILKNQKSDSQHDQNQKEYQKNFKVKQKQKYTKRVSQKEAFQKEDKSEQKECHKSQESQDEKKKKRQQQEYTQHKQMYTGPLNQKRFNNFQNLDQKKHKNQQHEQLKPSQLKNQYFLTPKQHKSLSKGKENYEADQYQEDAKKGNNYVVKEEVKIKSKPGSEKRKEKQVIKFT